MDKELEERILNPDLDHLELAEEDGIYEPLAAHIKAGGTLHPDTRAWLAKLLRGELPKKKKRGQKRTRSQRLADWRVFKAIQDIIRESGCTENAAIDRYSAEKGIPKDSIKTILRRT